MIVKSLQLNGVGLDEFQSIIGSAVTKVLQEHKELFYSSKREFQDEYLSRSETADFLKISKTTLWSLDKSQVLPAKRLNGKVLYLKSELLTFLNESA
ncbi:helix-turn-helix domain-containing protein [Maribacter sp. Asnod1-A12]|uniref:helix-turn-helix domain-containing protein n=1 Tax=Maribacter sp. Asnod1-A12 TaxID=3160576 RepID=UPI0038653542